MQPCRRPLQGQSSLVASGCLLRILLGRFQASQSSCAMHQVVEGGGLRCAAVQEAPAGPVQAQGVPPDVLVLLVIDTPQPQVCLAALFNYLHGIRNGKAQCQDLGTCSA